MAPIIGAEQPTYALLTTLRLPDGRSVEIPEEKLTVEHLNYKTIIGRVPMAVTAAASIRSLPARSTRRQSRYQAQAACA